MFSIKSCDLPKTAYLSKYRPSESSASQVGYTDCYSTTVDGLVKLEDYVFAFYTTKIFKLERFILKYIVNKPSTDEHAKQLLKGTTDTFAAWHVENKSEDQLLMCDFQKRTRSWFMVALIDKDINSKTILYFGSAVVPIKNPKTGKKQIGFGFSLLLGFHKLYSIILLYSAKQELKKLNK